MDALAAIAGEPLNQTIDIPLYRQLEDRILQLIASRMLNEGDALPPELDIAKSLGLSRSTVRRCYDDLVKDNRVVRHRGRGTFVAPPHDEHGFDVALNFTTRMKRLGKRVSSRVIDFKERPAQGVVATALRISEGAPIWEIKRVRLGDDVPLEYHIVYVPKTLCPNLTKEDLNDSLYAHMMQSSGMMPDHADELFECIKLDRREANILSTETGALAFRNIRTTYNEFGLPIEASISIYTATHCKLRIRVGRSETAFSIVSS